MTESGKLLTSARMDLAPRQFRFQTLRCLRWSGAFLVFCLGSLMPSRAAVEAKAHWSFKPLQSPAVPEAIPGWKPRNPIDRFVHSGLRRRGLRPSVEASKPVLLRRAALVLTGLPPSIEEWQAFLKDRHPDAYRRRVQAYLDTPRRAERWAKHWLDAAGYADSNGYFSADTDRPLAYRYRDYVIRSLHHDKPFDRFIREQLAGDEMSGWKPGQPANAGIIELLEATHFLRNGQDGSGESDGNPDEVRVDRYYALESSMQILGSSLLGLTVQCAKCHDHKFEPFTQSDYYSFQAFLYPAFNIEQWVKPNDRVVEASLPGELENWKVAEKQRDTETEAIRQELARWVRSHRVEGRTLFADDFESESVSRSRWSNRAPGDDTEGGSPPVTWQGEAGPSARVERGSLHIIEGGGSGDRWISTRASFDWRPARTNDWIEASFLLRSARAGQAGRDADRIGWMIALHDFDDSSSTPGGNLLIDGNPGGPSAIYVDYPGPDSKNRGSLGTTGYGPGRRYGVRITMTGEDRFSMQHWVDDAPDGPPMVLKGEDLPPGGFGFEYCCGRSFEVDDVRVAVSRREDPAWAKASSEFEQAFAERQKSADQQLQEIAKRRQPRPGQVAWVSDMSEKTPVVRVLNRGNPKTPGVVAEPAFPAFLSGVGHLPKGSQADGVAQARGRRTAWADWLTQPGSIQEGLLARNLVNRVWLQIFGTGLVSTPDNLGQSGANPTHPELLEWLAWEFARSGWSLKRLQALILDSAVFRQSSASRAEGLAKDSANASLWRFPVRRLDAESIRDGMLASSGMLGAKSHGPYVPTARNGAGEVVVDEKHPDAFARSIFLQQKRTQVATLLGVFDAPSIVFNCSKREPTTMPLQSLNLLNSEFAVRRGEDLARRVFKEAGRHEQDRLNHMFLLALGRLPRFGESMECRAFLRKQMESYRTREQAGIRAWSDLGQSMYLMNAYLYLE